jgi:AcrR family transcriptional regulator
MPSKPPKQKLMREVRKAQILEAAKRRFCDAGFHATTIAEVAKEADVSVGLIYKFYPSKEALIEGIVVADLDTQLSQLTGILEKHPNDFTMAMAAASENIVALILDRQRTALMIEIAAEATRNPTLQEFAALAQERVHGLLRERMAALKPEGWSMDQMEARLLVVKGLVQGIAIELAVQKRHPTCALFQSIEETLRHLLTPNSNK